MILLPIPFRQEMMLLPIPWYFSPFHLDRRWCFSPFCDTSPHSILTGDDTSSHSVILLPIPFRQEMILLPIPFRREMMLLLIPFYSYSQISCPHNSPNPGLEESTIPNIIPLHVAYPSLLWLHIVPKSPSSNFIRLTTKQCHEYTIFVGIQNALLKASHSFKITFDKSAVSNNNNNNNNNT